VRACRRARLLEFLLERDGASGYSPAMCPVRPRRGDAPWPEVTSLRRSFLRLSLLVGAVVNGLAPAGRAQESADIVIYGGTGAAVIAAVQARRMGKSVLIVCPERHLGGMSSGGLGFTDIGDKSVIGGLAREFYHRIWRHYQEPEAWRWQEREQFGNKGQGAPAIDGDRRTMWVFEPQVAERVCEDLIVEHGVPVHRAEWLDRERGVTKEGERILSLTMLSGRTFRGRVFIVAALSNRLWLAGATADGMHEPARSRLRLLVPYCLRLDPHGAGIHDSGAERGRRRRARNRCELPRPARRLSELAGKAA
jgi:hypothetical protein